MWLKRRGAVQTRDQIAKRSKHLTRRLSVDLLEQRELLSIFTVSSTGDQHLDDGQRLDGSLRQAILDANTHAGPDTIVFTIGTGPQAIQVVEALPTVTDTV